MVKTQVMLKAHSGFSRSNIKSLGMAPATGLFWDQGGRDGAPVPKHILWMDKILHHFETIGNRCFVGIYRGLIIPGFRRWCRISSIHSVDKLGRSNLQLYFFDSGSRHFPCHLDSFLENPIVGPDLEPQGELFAS